ncbi:MAG: IS1 family transposase [Gloeomargarita sp. SKYBB_i_bin120]|nr:IS1 family transposase [Gloeomargarita sp. SKYB120]MDW8177205.1 IS1 family transposase [Gloeomargarita sp. SKYBB_i_bin120]
MTAIGNLHLKLGRNISQAQRQLVDKMLLERLSIAAISRVTGISQSWLYKYVKPKAIYTSEMMDIQLGDDEEIELECDEIGSFCGSKKHLQWLWVVPERKTRMIVAACVGDRSIETAKKLWKRVPIVWRKRAKFYTDSWPVYRRVIPKSQHEVGVKGSGKTSLIERFNNTLRQRVSRLTRKTLFFSKNLENHIGIIFNFIHHYNASLLT